MWVAIRASTESNRIDFGLTEDEDGLHLLSKNATVPAWSLKMKKVLISFVVLLVCCVAFADANTSNLSDAQAMDFSNKAIFVMTNENTSVYTNLWNYRSYGYSNVVDFYFNGPSYVYTETKIDWTPYQGMTQITKDQFYTIIGRPDEAARYLNFKKSRQTWSNITVGALVVGVACGVGSAFTEDTVAGVFAIGAGASLLTSCIGLFMLDVVLVEEDQFSVSFAMNAAQSYNVSLLASYTTN